MISTISLTSEVGVKNSPTHLLEANHTPRIWNFVRSQISTMDQAKFWWKEHGQMLEENIEAISWTRRWSGKDVGDIAGAVGEFVYRQTHQLCLR